MKPDRNNWTNKNVQITVLLLVVLYIGLFLLLGKDAVVVIFFTGVFLVISALRNIHDLNPLAYIGAFVLSQVINFSICYGLVMIIRNLLVFKGRLKKHNNRGFS
jgi:hypothetical protein